jgi:hypothetical protein
MILINFFSAIVYSNYSYEYITSCYLIVCHFKVNGKIKYTLKLRGQSPRANCTNRATVACRRS